MGREEREEEGCRGNGFWSSGRRREPARGAGFPAVFSSLPSLPPTPLHCSPTASLPPSCRGTGPELGREGLAALVEATVAAGGGGGGSCKGRSYGGDEVAGDRAETKFGRDAGDGRRFGGVWGRGRGGKRGRRAWLELSDARYFQKDYASF
ncbi:hypothetical protein Pmani_039255 [Petrolisthes manimaculis]|uniref:Uncharacterized protein n=1 Tax=Petrolisthes manimaculis TaxID=1843537 RepID=A0AAE1ND63_9EUCA|nr:hypothetical protein Pmani_039255 [Petrolisthes manimaculis]